MKIALVHDYLTQQGGAENVFKIFTEIFPDAPIYTFFYDYKKFENFLAGRKVYSSFLQKIPGITKHYRWTLPLMPKLIESFDFSSYDFVLSSTSAFSKGIITDSRTRHVCYCHTPTRYLWIDSEEYVRELKYNKYIKRVIPPLLEKLRQWDRRAAFRVDAYLANSREVQKRIKKYYGKDSRVIYPPVDVENYYLSGDVEMDPSKGYYLVGGRLVAYKRYDLVVMAFNRMGIKLKIFGDGPEEGELRKMARSNIEFLGRVSEDKKRELMSKCIAFIHPQVEDFGITPVETMASGRPVIAYRAGGVLESVIDDVTGKFFLEQTWESLAETIIRFEPEKFDPRVIRLQAERFGVERFKREIKEAVVE
jgi:glycosyltransferase involved in cell wall biosynthesis